MLTSKNRSDREVAGIVASELDELCEFRTQGLRHPKEDALEGELREVGYLRLYIRGYSVRPYFTVSDGVMCMLAFDKAKRQQALSEGMRQRLKQRLRDIQE